MFVPLWIPEEKYFRAFDKAASAEKGPFGEMLKGRRKGKHFWIRLRKKGFFALFAPTLYGKTEEKGKGITYHILRPLFFLIPFLLWCSLLIFTGFTVLYEEPLFALCFLVPGVLFVLLSFRIPKRERAMLEKAFAALTEKKGDDI